MNCTPRTIRDWIITGMCCRFRNDLIRRCGLVSFNFIFCTITFKSILAAIGRAGFMNCPRMGTEILETLRLTLLRLIHNDTTLGHIQRYLSLRTSALYFFQIVLWILWRLSKDYDSVREKKTRNCYVFCWDIAKPVAKIIYV